MTRGSEIRLRNRLNERLATKEDALPRFRAILGDGEGNLYPDPTQPTIVYARRADRGRIDRCRNTRILTRDGLPVIVGYTRERPHELQVLEEDTAAVIAMGAYGYVRLHGQQHSLFDPNGGDDTVWVWGQQFLPFLVQQTDPISLRVETRAGRYVYEGSYETFGGGTTPDLSIHAPAAGLAIMLHIVVDAATATLDFVVGDEFSSALPEHMREEMIPLATDGQIPCAAIYIPNGITEITWDEIYDTRLFVQAVEGGVPHYVLSDTHVDTSPDTLVRGDILKAEEAGTTVELVRMAAGTSHQLLKMDVAGDDPEWDTFDWDDFAGAGGDMVHDHTNNAEGGVLPTGAFPHTILDGAAHTDTVAHVVAAGDLMYGDATPDWNALAHPGAADRVLQSGAALVQWSAQTLVIEAASIVDQDLTTDASVAFADVYVPDGGTFGIVGNELLTVNAAGTFAFSGIAGIAVEDADWIGNSAASARLGFDSSGATDYAYFSSCYVGIGTATPSVALHVMGDARFEDTDPLNIFRETDQVLPAGLWRLGATTDNFVVDKNTAAAGDFSTYTRTLTLGQTSTIAIFEGSANCIVRLLAPNGAISRLDFGDAADGDIGRINYSHADNSMAFYTNNAEHMRIISTGNIGVGATVPVGKLHVDNVGTIAQPVLYLDQGDVSEEMIEFATTIGVGNAIEAVGGKTLTVTHFIKVTLPGALTRYIPVGTIA